MEHEIEMRYNADVLLDQEEAKPEGKSLILALVLSSNPLVMSCGSD